MDRIIPAALMLDVILGDPRRPTHPVVLIGRGISLAEMGLRKVFQSDRELEFAGVILWSIIVPLTYISTRTVLSLGYNWNVWAGHAMSLWITYTTLALKDLIKEALGIYREVCLGRTDKARTLVARIVGRDTDGLSEGEIVRATVETVAENTIDGIVAPLFYAFIGGPALAMAFKAASTLDSMVGNKSEDYLYLGKWSAKMDDVLNYIPARLGGVIMVAVSALMGLNHRGATKAVFEDARKHASPNSGIPEAITAGALGVRLGGYNKYMGRREFRAYMGQKTREIYPKDILSVVRFSVGTTIFTLVAGEIAYFVVVRWWT